MLWEEKSGLASPSGFQAPPVIYRTALPRESQGHWAEPGLSVSTLLPALCPCDCIQHMADLWKDLPGPGFTGIGCAKAGLQTAHCLSGLLIKFPHVTGLSLTYKPVLPCVNQKYTFDSVPWCHRKGKHPVSSRKAVPCPPDKVHVMWITLLQVAPSHTLLRNTTESGNGRTCPTKICTPAVLESSNMGNSWDNVQRRTLRLPKMKGAEGSALLWDDRWTSSGTTMSPGKSSAPGRSEGRVQQVRVWSDRKPPGCLLSSPVERKMPHLCSLGFRMTTAPPPPASAAGKLSLNSGASGSPKAPWTSCPPAPTPWSRILTSRSEVFERLGV